MVVFIVSVRDDYDDEAEKLHGFLSPYDADKFIEEYNDDRLARGFAKKFLWIEQVEVK